jgi:hypothetical protein
MEWKKKKKKGKARANEEDSRKGKIQAAISK